MKSRLTSGRFNEIMVAYWEKFHVKYKKGIGLKNFLKMF